MAADASDAELVGAALQGELRARHAAFAQLLGRYEGKLRALMRSLCRDVQAADDLTQDAMLKAWTQLPSLRQPQAFAAWLKQLAYREFLHRQRRQQVEARYAQGVQAAGESERSADVSLGAELEQLLQPCTPQERELLVLLYAFEFTYAELAAARNEPEGSLKSQVHRIKARIQRHVDSAPAARAADRDGVSGSIKKSVGHPANTGKCHYA